MISIKDETALRAKLSRLSREVRGRIEATEVWVGGKSLRVYPVEWVVANAEKRGLGPSRQRTLFE